MAGPDTATDKKQNPLREIVQPFIDFAHSPRAVTGVNISYFLEGFVYFGMLGYLAMYFNQYVGLTDIQAGPMVGVLTWGITFAMFLFGGLADKWGVRIALIAALALMLVGRVLLASGPTVGLSPDGLWSAAHLAALLGILFIVLGYGMYQPAAYAAVRLFTTPKTAAMGYAMLYALMNLGGWLPTFFSPIRRAVGISGSYWVYSGITLLGLLLTALILSKKTVAEATTAAKIERERLSAREDGDETKQDPGPITSYPSHPKEEQRSFLQRVWLWFKNHPLADPKFSFFIFCLIPVQTLFAHNWLTLPMYVERAYRESWPWISVNFEPAVNFNPLLIFILVPIVTAITQKAKVYRMMILGTLVMALPTFFLALGPKPWTLVGYLVIMTIGEAMWQPRFLQYAAEIAPEGRTGAYMGVAQFPWFLTKVITSLYSGWFLTRYCPDDATLDAGIGNMATEQMWFIYGLIAISSPIMLILARHWLGKDFKTKSD
jgi:MFS family permease